MDINPRKEFGKYGIKNLKKFIQTLKKKIGNIIKI